MRACVLAIEEAEQIMQNRLVTEDMADLLAPSEVPS